MLLEGRIRLPDYAFLQGIAAKSSDFKSSRFQHSAQFDSKKNMFILFANFRPNFYKQHFCEGDNAI